MAEGAQKVAFELVSPERLLFAASVDMVVVPGSEGDFGVLPGHSLFVSSIRPGVIEVYDKGAVTDRIFIAGGFAEATPEGCTVLADKALPVADLKRGEIEALIHDAREDVEDAKDEAARTEAEKRLAVAEAMLAACPG
ncbi:MAG: F0F1 ATP synthase subunit epsilon [Alphaproteobacteria bacterium]